KATDKHGLPFDVDGEIIDSKGKVITAFNAAHDGMGYFTFTPAVKEQYRARWKDGFGKLHHTPLPAAQKEGMVLQIDQDMEGIQFVLTRSGPETRSNANAQVVGQMQHQMVYPATVNLSKNPSVKRMIPPESIPAGIVQITI